MAKEEQGKWVQIGECPVDSGQLLLIDPSYLEDWKDGASDDDSNYAECCKQTLSKGHGQVLYGHGLVCGTRFGDGVYPVEAFFGGDGCIERVVIDFTRSSDVWPCEKEGGRLPSGEEIERTE
jgi:hypothetical protein